MNSTYSFTTIVDRCGTIRGCLAPGADGRRKGWRLLGVVVPHVPPAAASLLPSLGHGAELRRRPVRGFRCAYPAGLSRALPWRYTADATHLARHRRRPLGSCLFRRSFVLCAHPIHLQQPPAAAVVRLPPATSKGASNCNSSSRVRLFIRSRLEHSNPPRKRRASASLSLTGAACGSGGVLLVAGPVRVEMEPPADKLRPFHGLYTWRVFSTKKDYFSQALKFMP